MRSPKMWLAALPALLFAARPAAPFTGSPESADLDIPLAYDAYHAQVAARPTAELPATRAQGLGAGWLVQSDPVTGRVRMAYGGTVVLAPVIRDAAQAESQARAFVLAHEELLGVRADNVRTQSVRRGPAQWVVWFQQVVDDVSVWNGTAFVLLGESGRVAAFGSEFQPEPRDLARAALSSEAATLAATHSLGTSPRADRPQDAALWWMPLPQDESVALSPVWRVVFESEQPFGKWETFVHGATGEILGRRNLYFTVDVYGQSQGRAAVTPPSYGWCDGFARAAYMHQNVRVEGGGSAQTDENGNFRITNADSTRVQLNVELEGPFCNVNRLGGGDASQSVRARPGVPVMIRWTPQNSRDDERTTFWHANRVHDFMKFLDPTFMQLDYPMPSTIGRMDGFCPGNAWWDGNGMNYCESGAGYYNTGTMGDVIYHEYGHGVTQAVYTRHGQPEPPGALHEGNSDILANFLDRNPFVGLGFSTNTGCGSGIRNAENQLTYPTYSEAAGEAHQAGQVLEGFHWLAWQTLLANLPQAMADSIAFRTWHYGRDLGTPRTFPDQVTWTFFADDDDANLTNGTPHCDVLCEAAQAKGFTCPPCGILFDHEPPEHTTDGSQGFDLVATIHTPAAPIDLALSGVLYRVNGGPFSQLSLTATGNPDEYTTHVPPQGSNSEVEYYYLVVDLLGHSRKSPPTAPAALYNVDVAWQIDNLEGSAAGWLTEAPTDDALSGWWTLVDPVGTGAQPEDDATPSGVQCFITGQCAPGENDCTITCQLACSDVDGGTTTLFSPVYDLTGASSAKIKYSRWYTNAALDNPGEDYWDVDVSNDGGASWTSVEHTTLSDQRWVSEGADIVALFGTPGHVRLRFKASDYGGGSIVEAGVDDLRILATFGEAALDVAAAPSSAVPATLALESGQPNPFRTQTLFDWALPRTGPVELTVYDVGGRALRKLVSGTRDAGRYRAEWDGRDGRGGRVAAGVYFVRLVAQGDAVTRKVMLVQ